MSEACSDRCKIDIVTQGVPFQDQHSLDAQRFLQGRHHDLHAVTGHLDRFQRLAAYQLPDTGLDAVKRTQDQNRAADTRGLPAGHGLQCRENCVEPFPKVGEDGAGIPGKTVSRMNAGCRSSNQDSLGEVSLQT